MYKYLTLLILSIASLKANHISYAKLCVKVRNVENEGGTLRIGIFNKQTGIFSTTYKWDDVKVLNGQSEYTFLIDSLPYDDYAVAVYHDLNDDNDLNANLVGIPIEPFALSNLNTIVAIPTFEKIKFSLTSPKKEIVLSLKTIF